MFIVADLVSLKQETSSFFGILVFMRIWNFVLSWIEHEKRFITSRPCLVSKLFAKFISRRHALYMFWLAGLWLVEYNKIDKLICLRFHTVLNCIWNVTSIVFLYLKSLPCSTFVANSFTFRTSRGLVLNFRMLKTILDMALPKCSLGIALLDSHVNFEEVIECVKLYLCATQQ